MKSVDVLAWIDRIDDALRIDVLRQRQLHQNAVDIVVGIELGDQRQELGFAGGLRQVPLEARNAGRGRGFALGAHVHLACRIVAYEHGAKPGYDP